MAELIAVGFDDPNEADRALTELTRLQREYLIDLEDAVVAIRRPDGKVSLKQSVNLVGLGAASGAMWGGLFGSLIGLLFLNPLAGFALGGLMVEGASRASNMPAPSAPLARRSTGFPRRRSTPAGRSPRSS